MEKKINLKIDGISVSVPSGSTILDAANVANVRIPTLCYLRKINAIGACRICLVEVKNIRPLVAACVYPASEGMEVLTHTDRVNKARKINLELILSAHVKNCLSCAKSMNCELQKLSLEYGCNENHFKGAMPKRTVDNSSPCLIRDSQKCILCKRCKAACYETQTVKVIAVNNRGFESYLGCAYDAEMNDTACVSCGQCTLVCPTGALMVKSDVDKVLNALSNPELTVVVAPAPSVRVGIAEEFGEPVGTNAEGRLVTALRMLGFNKVFDIDFAADLTIMEEANELVERIQNKGLLPMMTSCSPGWVNFLTAYYPEMIPHLSSAKSPQGMFGATVKTYWVEKNKLDPAKVFVTTIMPCTAKKHEILRKKDMHDNTPDIDAVLTVRELGLLLKRQGINFTKLSNGTFDDPLGESTGAGVIFGVTGGVMEAALRTAADTLTGKSLDSVDYKKVRGTKGIKEATVDINGMKINVCAASGLANARRVLEDVKSGKKQYHFIEIMACPGGCVNGGGMPIHNPNEISFEERAKARAKSIYKEDERKTIRKSHENTQIIQLYKEYFGKPGSHKAHEVLHTTHDKRRFI
ncbi:MAG: [FeFe] hydrogenase, group A [Mycoplasmataceae bacterium]|nr:[FeFe] hydrogenase, group A [Mycoplasmataceae bacterium]